MSNEQLRRIAIALASLLVLWLLLLGIRRIARHEGPTFPVPSFDRLSVDRIAVARQTDSITLARTADGWTVNGYPAAQARVAEFLDAVADSGATPELVAESPTTHERLGIDSVNARRVQFMAGDRVLLAYLVGKRGASFQSAYVRRPNRNNVFQMRGTLIEMVERGVADWRDKLILRLEPDSLNRIEIERGDDRYALARSDSGWRFVDGAATDSAGVATLLSQYRQLEASSFANDDEASGAQFDAAERVVRLFGPGDVLLTTMRFDSIAGGFWVRRDTLPTVYRIASWVVDQLAPPDSGLRQPPPPIQTPE